MSPERDLNLGPSGTKQPLYHLSYHPLTELLYFYLRKYLALSKSQLAQFIKLMIVAFFPILLESYNDGTMQSCVLMFYCVLNNIAFKIFLKRAHNIA